MLGRLCVVLLAANTVAMDTKGRGSAGRQAKHGYGSRWRQADKKQHVQGARYQEAGLEETRAKAGTHAAEVQTPAEKERKEWRQIRETLEDDKTGPFMQRVVSGTPELGSSLFQASAGVPHETALQRGDAAVSKRDANSFMAGSGSEGNGNASDSSTKIVAGNAAGAEFANAHESDAGCADLDGWEILGDSMVDE